MHRPNWVVQTIAAYDAGQALSLIFDYDGTLTPIVSHPSLALLSDANRDALATLAALERATVGIISGRAIGNLQELVGLPSLKYAGSGGMQLNLGNQLLEDIALAHFEQMADEVTVALAKPLATFIGSWVERKPGCLTVHYRTLQPLNAVWFEADVRECIARQRAAARPLRVRKVTRSLEITPAEAWTKGEAIERMIGEPNTAAFVLFAGDGANDAEAVDVVNARGGLSIGIGNEAPANVQMCVETPQEFAVGLSCLARELKSRASRDDFASSAVIEYCNM